MESRESEGEMGRDGGQQLEIIYGCQVASMLQFPHSLSFLFSKFLTSADGHLRLAELHIAHSISENNIFMSQEVGEYSEGMV